jgi:hypothetical protein
LPVDEALAIAKQIAEALEAAHEQGIVHRDLKPGNIKLRPDGTVKVLDFGLAKAVDTVGSGQSTVGGDSQAPTITTPAMTQAGVILGTAAYMSPEQARGVAVDKRADIWALGRILYEMLAGRGAFEGELVSDVMASVLKSEQIASGIPAGGGGAAPFSVSAAGVLVYWTQSLIQQAQLQWLDRNGNVLGQIGQPAVYDGFDLAPDDARVAAAQVGELGNDIWVHDLATGSAFPATFNTQELGDTVPLWTRDGGSLTFLTPGIGDGSALRHADVGGNADAVTLATSNRNMLAGSWNVAGDQLVFEEWTPDNGVDLAVLHDDGRVERLEWNTPSDAVARHRELASAAAT